MFRTATPLRPWIFRFTLCAGLMISTAACTDAPTVTVPPGEALGAGHARVMALMRARRDATYEPGSHSDGHHLCLVAQGGGMRGVIGAAAAVALDQLGFGRVFDGMYGTSAGGLTVAYLAAGQIAFGTSIYYQNLAGHGHFINPWRLGEPMDIGFLFDQWITRGKALDLDAVARSPIRIGVTTTALASGETRVFDNRELSGADFVKSLRASASMPLYSNNREDIRGARYTDGFVRASVPVAEALASGCDHLVVLPTALPEFRESIGPLGRIHTSLKLSGEPAPFLAAFKRRDTYYNETMDLLYDNDGGTPTLVLPPRAPNEVPTSRETEPEPLVRAAEAALRRVERVFGADPGATKLYFAPEGLKAYPTDATPHSLTDKAAFQ